MTTETSSTTDPLRTTPHCLHTILNRPTILANQACQNYTHTRCGLLSTHSCSLVNHIEASLDSTHHTLGQCKCTSCGPLPIYPTLCLPTSLLDRRECVSSATYEFKSTQILPPQTDKRREHRPHESPLAHKRVSARRGTVLHRRCRSKTCPHAPNKHQ